MKNCTIKCSLWTEQLEKGFASCFLRSTVCLLILTTGLSLSSCYAAGPLETGTPVPSETEIRTAADESWSVPAPDTGSTLETTPEEPSEPEPVYTDIVVTDEVSFASPFAVADIHTERAVTNKEDYVKGTMILRHGDRIWYGGEGTDAIEIRWRGNSSLAFKKKPFKIKLGEAADLFGFGKNRHWLLLACMFDRSMLRDKIALDFSAVWFPFHTESTYVEVLMNGRYIGTYQLCEQIRVSKNRLNITNIENILEEDGIGIAGYTEENGYDTTGGYLMEVSVQYDEKSKFRTKVMNVPIMIKEPEDAAANPEMMKYLQSLFQNFELTIRRPDLFSMTGKHYSEYFDFDDLVHYWVLSQLYKTHDFMINSTFLYKDTADEKGVPDKIHMGPIWDIGNSLGNYTVLNKWRQPTEPETWDSPSDGSKNWYQEICRDPYFMIRAQEALCELVEPIREITREGGQLDRYAEQLAPSVAATQILYPSFGDDRVGLPENETFEDELEWIREFLEKRFAFLCAELSDLKHIGLSYCTFRGGSEEMHIRVTDKFGQELPTSEEENAVGARADYEADTSSPLTVFAESAKENASYALIAVNDCRLGKYPLDNASFEAEIPPSKLTASGGHKNVVTIRLFDKNDKWIATDFVTIANQE